MSNIRERHRDLTVVFAESALGWANFVIETIEHNVRQFGAGEVSFAVPPRELLSSQCRFIGWYDDENLRAIVKRIGAECVLRSWDFPVGSSDEPRVRSLN